MDFVWEFARQKSVQWTIRTLAQEKRARGRSESLKYAEQERSKDRIVGNTTV